MLKQSDIDLYTEEKDEAVARQEELKAEHEATRTEIGNITLKIKENEEANEKLRIEMRDLRTKLETIAAEHNPLNQVISNIEEKLEKDAWEKSVKEMVEKQADFYTVLERELTKIQEELKETVGDFVEFEAPATACKTIRAAIERGGIGQRENTLRSGIQNYNQAIRDLCERKLRGEPIDLQRGALPVDRLKDWLRHGDVILYWKK